MNAVAHKILEAVADFDMVEGVYNRKSWLPTSFVVDVDDVDHDQITLGLVEGNEILESFGVDYDGFAVNVREGTIRCVGVKAAVAAAW